MPFIGRDWRSPGDKWVKLNKGWEELKLLDNSKQVKYGGGESATDTKSLENSSSPGQGSATCAPNNFEIEPDNEEKNGRESPRTLLRNMLGNNSTMPVKPYIFNGKQQYSSPRGFTSLKDAFRKLDFLEGINDMKRFNYISKVLSLMIKERLHTLSGNGQKCVFTLAESVIEHGLNNNRNFRLLHSLVRDLSQAIAQDCAYGRHVGSDALWTGHAKDVARWKSTLEHRFDYGQQNHHNHTDHHHNHIHHKQPCEKRCKKAKNESASSLKHDQPGIADETCLLRHKNTGDKRSAVLADLPRECLFKIVSCLSDHQDLINLSNCSSFKKSHPDAHGLGFTSQKGEAQTNKNVDSGIEHCREEANHDICFRSGLMERIHILSRVFSTDAQPDDLALEMDVQPDDVCGRRDAMENLSQLANLADCAGDAFLWHKLCRFHFTEQQIAKRIAASSNPKIVGDEVAPSQDDGTVDWQNMFFKLKRYYGVKEIYANMLHFCLGCKCIFWKEIGHPCAHDETGNNPHPTIRIYPHEFIEIILF